MGRRKGAFSGTIARRLEYVRGHQTRGQAAGPADKGLFGHENNPETNYGRDCPATLYMLLGEAKVTAARSRGLRDCDPGLKVIGYQLA